MTEFFAAANTEDGFFSLFDEIFTPEAFRCIYILKGGPGTGKSTLMRRLGREAEVRGAEPEYLYCSSDTHSLDGLLLPSLGVAVLDGTAPHMRDPRYPGAVERTVDLASAFDMQALKKKRETLVTLIDGKADAYRTAYRFLSAAGVMQRENEALLHSVFLEKKARAAIMRLVSGMKKRKSGKETVRYLSAIATDGEVRLGTLAHRARKIYAVTNKYAMGYLYMRILREILHAEGVMMTVCPSPLVRAQTEAIFIEGEDALFILSDGKEPQAVYKTVNILRFADKEALTRKRKRLRLAEHHREELKKSALLALAEAGALHMKTERIYGDCIDFSVTEALTQSLLSEIFENNM